MCAAGLAGVMVVAVVLEIGRKRRLAASSGSGSSYQSISSNSSSGRVEMGSSGGYVGIGETNST